MSYFEWAVRVILVAIIFLSPFVFAMIIDFVMEKIDELERRKRK